jgi:urease accessory protein
MLTAFVSPASPPLFCPWRNVTSFSDESFLMRAHWLNIVHLLDSSFPTGAYVHSSGLESFPLAREALETVLLLRAEQSIARLELPFVHHAYAGDLADLDARYHTLQLVREQREASAAIGTSLLRSASEILSHVRVRGFLRDGPHRHHPLAFGVIAAACEMPADLAMQAYAFGSLRAQVSAAQRLGWIGQRDAQGILHRLKPSVRAAAQTAVELDLDAAGAFAPMWDIASMMHERADARMFAS